MPLFILTLDFSGLLYPISRMISKVLGSCSVMVVVVCLNRIHINSFIFYTCMCVSLYASERVSFIAQIEKHVFKKLILSFLRKFCQLKL